WPPGLIAPGFGQFSKKFRSGCRFLCGPLDHKLSARRICLPSTKGELSSTQVKGPNMRVMVLVKACKESESGVMPIRQKLAEMGKFNDELVKAGIMLVGEGLKPSSTGV